MGAGRGVPSRRICPAAATPRSCWRRWRRSYTTCSAAWRVSGSGRAARRGVRAVDDLPAVTCRMRLCEARTYEDKYNSMYEFYSQCVKRAACCRTSRCSPCRTGGTFWRGTSGTSRIRFTCACPSGQGGRHDAVTLPAVPGAVGAVLRRARRRGRGVAGAGPAGGALGVKCGGSAAGAGHRRALLRAGDRGEAVLPPAGPARGGVRGIFFLCLRRKYFFTFILPPVDTFFPLAKESIQRTPFKERGISDFPFP